MAKICNISGFPEWLPEQRIAEERITDRVKAIYASYGYVPIETPAVELLSTLAAKGVIDKEIYVLRRAQATEDEEAEIALHFDLTVPYARYVAQHFNDLVFPFKRYQLQKAWRGDRPQRGRFREFCQCDVDVIARDELPLACDAEILTVLDKAVAALGLGAYVIKINSRKILQGIYRALGLDEVQRKGAITVVDKIAKIGAAGVESELREKVGIAGEAATSIVSCAQVRLPAADLAKVPDLTAVHDGAFTEGVRELEQVFSLIPAETLTRVELDLSLARGLDYYTGAIFEVVMPAHPEFGSIGGGGRYDDLAGEFINKKLPGVGYTIGITRAMDLGFAHNLIPLGGQSLVPVLVAVWAEEQRAECNALAERLRRCGIGAEVFYRAPKLGKQLEYAEKKGIRYTLFIDPESKAVQVKDVQSKEQHALEDVERWCRELRTA